jgi:alkaline phosphatase D
MPIRDNESKVLYRDFSYGELVDIIVLDERLEGRSEHAESLKDVDEDQTMLGVRQLHWFKNKLASSNAIWKVIGNQVIFSELDLGVVRPTSPKNMDAWDGYAIERDKIIDHISENNIENVVIVTGDTHSSWAFEVPKSVQDYKQTRDAVAIEFGTPSISSANWNERNPDQEVIAAEHIGMDHNPHLKFVNGRDHGYMVLSLTPNKAQADWYYVDNVQDQNSEERHAKSISVEKGKLKLTVEK